MALQRSGVRFPTAPPILSMAQHFLGPSAKTQKSTQHSFGTVLRNSYGLYAQMRHEVARPNSVGRATVNHTLICSKGTCSRIGASDRSGLVSEKSKLLKMTLGELLCRYLVLLFCCCFKHGDEDRDWGKGLRNLVRRSCLSSWKIKKERHFNVPVG